MFLLFLKKQKQHELLLGCWSSVGRSIDEILALYVSHWCAQAALHHEKHPLSFFQMKNVANCVVFCCHGVCVCSEMLSELLYPLVELVCRLLTPLVRLVCVWKSSRLRDVQLILTWQGRYHDQEGGSPRARLSHCTAVVLTLANSPNVGISTA